MVVLYVDDVKDRYYECEKRNWFCFTLLLDTSPFIKMNVTEVFWVYESPLQKSVVLKVHGSNGELSRS